MLISDVPPFFLPAGKTPAAERAGFRFGAKGTHTSRTLMVGDLEGVLSATPSAATRADYAAAIIDRNCLMKSTVATRRSSNQRLGELYALDPGCLLFRVLRKLWIIDDASHALLAMLAGLARDPLFMVSTRPVLAVPVGAELRRSDVTEALRTIVDDRMNDAVLDKVVRNVSSSWCQAGHLRGRTFKIRQPVQTRPVALAYAIGLGYVAGFRGEELLSTGWVAALDSTPLAARGLATEAHRLGLLDIRSHGTVIEFGLERLDPALGSI